MGRWVMALALGVLLVQSASAWVGPFGRPAGFQPDKLQRLIEALENPRLAGRT